MYQYSKRTFTVFAGLFLIILFFLSNDPLLDRTYTGIITTGTFPRNMAQVQGKQPNSKLDVLAKLPAMKNVKFKHDKDGHIHYNRSSNCRLLPDILIIGFEKCGTMTLRKYLSSHPSIYITNTNLSIPYFSLKQYQSLEKFTENMSCTPNDQLRLEKISTTGIASKAYETVPNIKLIAIVREPVERALSHHVHRIAREKEQVNDFDVVINRILDGGAMTRSSVLFRQSLYVDRLSQWLQTFGIDKIHFVDGDHFVKDPASELRKLERYLNIIPYFTKDHFIYNPEKKFFCLRAEGNVNGCMNTDKGRPHPVMSNHTRRRLQLFFKPYNEKLFSIIGRNFSWNY